MSNEPVQSALALFRDACELPQGERATFLDAACGADAELRRQVESMLAWDDAEDAAKDDAVSHPVREVLANLADEAASAASAAAALPATIGGYRVVRLVAQGGMGVVYEARQEHPERRVAIKVARVGSPTGERARRFELEAQLLARLHHPGIAQIIEAGTTPAEAGAMPFFVMEFVEGQSLTDYAAMHLGSAREKLQMMVRVCAPVAFAHAQGVVHRDLKPDNVLIEPGGEPKVLDFGVAKVEAAGGFGAATLRTEAGRVIGTLGYMAPEQLAGTTEGIGPAADVYSLGVMIYELLSGRLPHELSAATLTRALAVVATTDAPRLSVIRPEHRGDIEALVGKALEKNPRHRYADAAALQQDLERYLRGEPILARPAGPLRRLTKWTHRNPALATSVLGLFLTLAAAAAVLLVKNQQVRAALDDNERLLDTRRLRLARLETDELLPTRPEKAEALQRWLDDTHRLLDRTDKHRATLQQLRDQAGHQAGTEAAASWTFADPLLQRKHDELAMLVQGLEALASDTALFAQMQARLDLARTIARKTIDDRRADWDAAIARIRAPDSKYGGFTIVPQLGLVPLGQDPDSGLEEFLHFETHRGAIPPAGDGARRTLGFADTGPGPDTGIVFVLIPGGTYWMGAQWEHEDQPNYDPEAKMGNREGPPRQIPVGPFFLAKFEMTQAQWERFVGENPSCVQENIVALEPKNPVNQVTWTECYQTMRRLGLVLPDDEQWEYAARAGTTTSRWTGTGRESLAEAENLSNNARGFKTIAPVGSFAPNPFGLYDMLGNVREWCSNHPGNDPERYPETRRMRMTRGGGRKLDGRMDTGRSSFRFPARTEFDESDLGLRPARPIDP